MTNRFVGVVALVVLSSTGASAQLIPVKTLPIAETEQFSFFPTAGRVGISMTLADTLLDPFRNPASGGRIARSQYFGAPSFFTVSENAGGGTTFPMGAFARRGSTFVGLAAAFQEIENTSQQQFLGGGGFSPFSSSVPAVPFEGEQPRSHHNNYAFALLGRSFGAGGGTSIAVSALWSGLESLDGVDGFYFNNAALKQDGGLADLRIGITHDLGGGQSVEAILLRNRFDMTHDVGFIDFVWDPSLRQAVPRARTELNGEKTDVWGLHLEYERPIIDSTWRAGVLATTNVIKQPRIPFYELTSGMGTHGEATALNLGVGVGRTAGLLSFGLDAIYEPIRSHTWSPDSLDNRFRFHNARFRGGISRDFKMMVPGNLVRMHLNADYHWVNYWMDQRDEISSMDRTRRESWLERGRGGGVSFVTPSLQLHYQVQSRIGMGRPGVVSNDQIAVLDLSIAPWGPVPVQTTLGNVSVTRHQFSVSVPVR